MHKFKERVIEEYNRYKEFDAVVKTLNDKFEIKAGYVDGARVDVSIVEALAKLPSRDELLGQIAFGLLSPVRMLAVALTGLVEQKGAGVVEAVEEVKEEVAVEVEATEVN